MNNYDDYYSYMNNYMTNSSGMPNYTGPLDYGMNYQNFDNNTFANNFMNKTDNAKLVTPEEGLKRGNLFEDMYVPYKNYRPSNVEAKTEKGKLLNQILSYGFAMKDLNLYLDLHPNNASYINLYNDYRKMKKTLCDKYEKMYGPLNLNSDMLENNNWIWINSPWPWEGEK